MNPCRVLNRKTNDTLRHAIVIASLVRGVALPVGYVERFPVRGCSYVKRLLNIALPNVRTFCKSVNHSQWKGHEAGTGTIPIFERCGRQKRLNSFTTNKQLLRCGRGTQQEAEIFLQIHSPIKRQALLGETTLYSL